ncbi:MAG: TIGR00730 family Rossman fold protein [Dysgonamonadaceae bacterium]|jgi:uncharacterized protein (TIGR00730 family)|nr:TIGR00730 family Rossman fold protein [Dysgonamonadaceae bacterium]
MSQKIKTITVYASSCQQIAPVYFEAAEALGKLLAEQHITCINGGGYSGLMATITETMIANGGKVIGVLPQFMIDKGWVHPNLSETVVTENMHQRKQWMADKSDACIALPGGAGTFDELMEIIAWKQLELYRHPVVILNTNGYYERLLAMLNHSKEEKFIPEEYDDLWSVAQTPQEALEIICSSFNEEKWKY